MRITIERTSRSRRDRRRFARWLRQYARRLDKLQRMRGFTKTERERLNDIVPKLRARADALEGCDEAAAVEAMAASDPVVDVPELWPTR